MELFTDNLLKLVLQADPNMLMCNSFPTSKPQNIKLRRNQIASTTFQAHIIHLCQSM
jgi:hypothetical protein